MRVLRHVHRLCRPGGLVLDLTSVPPAATVERDGVALGQLDQESFLQRAARTEAAVDLFVADGLLVEEAAVEVEVLNHFESGADVVDDVAGRGATRMPPELGATLEQIVVPVVERYACLLRRFRVRRLARQEAAGNRGLGERL